MSLPDGGRLGDHPAIVGRIYSIGYEGLSLDGLIERLTGAKVRVLVDVRLNPVSRKPGFSRSACPGRSAMPVSTTSTRGRSATRPRTGRRSAPVTAKPGRTRMRAVLSDGAGGALDRVVELASRQRIAVLCVERDHHRCHRDVITEMATERNPAIEVVHVL